MKENMSKDAVSEILGTVLLLAMAVALFAVLYIIVFSITVTTTPPIVNLVGSIDGDNVIIEHHGGESLDSDVNIIVTIGGVRNTINVSSNLSDSNGNGKWDTGERIVYSNGSISGVQVDANVVDDTSNSLIFIATLQEGTTPSSPGTLNTSVSSISPYDVSSSPKSISATSTGTDPDNITLYYRWSENNNSWQNGYETIEIGNNESTMGTGTSLQINKPSGLEDEDILVAFIVKDDNAGTLSPPNDWTQSVYKETTSGHDVTSGIWYKIVEDADDESGNSSYTWTHTDGNEQMSGGIFIIKNVNISSPLDASTVSNSGSNDDTIDCPSITTNTDNAMVLTFACKTHTVTGVTEPPGTTEIWSKFINHANSYCSYYIQANAGATGIKTWDDDRTQEWHSYQMAFKPNSIEGVNWSIWSNVNNPDISSPWTWTFNFPNSTGYYEFYSIGKKTGLTDETAPSSADAICRFE